ncbi:hypothetical protein JCM10213_005810 [Rhodosporidiobolus nylandii]
MKLTLSAVLALIAASSIAFAAPAADPLRGQNDVSRITTDKTVLADYWANRFDGKVAEDENSRMLAKRSAKLNEARAIRAAVESAGLEKRRDNHGRGPADGGPGNRGPGNPPRPGNAGPPSPPNPPRPANGPGPKGPKENNGVGKGRGGGRDDNRGNHNGHGHHGPGGNDSDDDDTDTDGDVRNCGGRFIVCPESYNGVGEPVCDYGKCRLRCPPGLREFFAHNPEVPSFCAE